MKTELKQEQGRNKEKQDEEIREQCQRRILWRPYPGSLRTTELHHSYRHISTLPHKHLEDTQKKLFSEITLCDNQWLHTVSHIITYSGTSYSSMTSSQVQSQIKQKQGWCRLKELAWYFRESWSLVCSMRCDEFNNFHQNKPNRRTQATWGILWCDNQWVDHLKKCT